MDPLFSALIPRPTIPAQIDGCEFGVDINRFLSHVPLLGRDNTWVVCRILRCQNPNSYIVPIHILRFLRLPGHFETSRFSSVLHHPTILCLVFFYIADHTYVAIRRSHVLCVVIGPCEGNSHERVYQWVGLHRIYSEYEENAYKTISSKNCIAVTPKNEAPNKLRWQVVVRALLQTG